MNQPVLLSENSSIEEVLSLCPEIYQDVVIGGKLIQPGDRCCKERGDLILEYIEDGESVLDMGANFAYFGQRILSEKKNCCYLGIEREITFSFIAAKVVEQFSGAAIVNGDLDYDTLKLMDDCCEHFDTIILTSIIHHFPKDKLVEMCLILDRMCKKVIIEASVPGDSGACGQDILFEVFNRFKSIDDALAILFPNKNFKQIGSAQSHVSSIARPIFVGSQREGKEAYSKNARDPYIGKMSNERKYFIRGEKMVKQNLLNSGNEIVLIKPGFLLWNWSMCGRFITPSRQRLIDEASARFRELPTDATDIRPWNIIWSAKGLTFIDIASQVEPEHCNLQEGDLDMVITWFDSIFSK